MQPRMLIRRSLALIIDWVLVAFITTLFMYPFVRGHTDQIRFSSSVFSALCWQSTTGPKELVQFIENKPLSDLIICKKKPFFFFDNGLTAKLIYNATVKKSGGLTVTSSTNITIDIDDKGMPINTVSPQGFITLALLIIASAFLLFTKHGQTPGKSIMGLRVANISRQAALSREFWRFAPLIPIMLFTALPNSILQTLLQNFWVFTLVMITTMVFTVWYYIYPMIRWTGVLRHDKITGTHVERS